MDMSFDQLGNSTTRQGCLAPIAQKRPINSILRPRGAILPTGAIVLAAVLGVTACSTVPPHPPSPPEPSPEAGFKPNLSPYRIQVGDVLDVRLLLNPELNEQVTVRPDGHISTTLVHDVPAYGRTVTELNSDLRRAYARDLKEPRLSVVVKSFAPTRTYVGGEVNNPGEFITVGPNLTLSQAIARAGGLKYDNSSDKEIFIIRRGPGDVPEFLSTHYNDIMYGKDPSADVRLAPYDVVYVPRSGIADVYRFLNSYFLRFVPVSWGFSYVVNQGGSGSTVVTSP
jgi:polysaccharide biosynthesis/export protein